jgi:hypothetical protein
MQKPLLVLAAVFVSLLTAFSCTRSNPGAPQPKPVDTTALLSSEYIVSTYVTYPRMGDLPADLAISPDGTLYVCGLNGSIWKITADSTPSLLTTAGVRTQEIAFDPMGNMYLLAIDIKSILRVTPAGVVTTFAGGAHQPIDGQGAAAGFSFLNDLVIDSSGTLYVADYNTIRKVDQSGLVTTLYKDSSANTQISAITLDRAHNLYFASLYQLWRLDAAGNKTFIAGDSAQISADGTGSAAKFQGIWALQPDKNGNLIAGDFSEVRQISPSGVVGTIAGSAKSDTVDGPGNLASFRYVIGLAVDKKGTIFVADGGNYKIRKIVHK